MYWKNKRPFVSVVIVAAGSATRMDGIDKQLVQIGGMPVFLRSVVAFEQSEKVDEIILVTREESIAEFNRQVREYGVEKVKTIVAGGKTRQASVFCGVACVDARCAYLAIHDGARPLVLTGAVDACIEDAFAHEAALLGVKVKDTIKLVDAQRFIAKTVERENLFIAQTPQIFELSLYRRAMQHALDTGAEFTDDCQLVEAIGGKVYVSRGQESNLKITTPDDIFYAEALLQSRED